MSISLDLDHHSHVDRPRSGRTSLVGLMKPELRDVLKGIGLDDREAKMRASQLWNWIYHNGVTDFDKMSNIQKGFRQKLSDTFLLDRPEIVSEQISMDGTRKWLFRFRDPKNPLLPPVEVETVYIPEEDRGTLCVSSQVGCTLTCSFCHTGTQKLVRNLTAEEILSQLLLARDPLPECRRSRSRPVGQRRAAGTAAATCACRLRKSVPRRSPDGQS